ncbi:MAG: hypothetical protein HUU20_11430 [Pirellulales bacterium]|nr:hypothetical protein [Pirellulales bacterium]
MDLTKLHDYDRVILDLTIVRWTCGREPAFPADPESRIRQSQGIRRRGIRKQERPTRKDGLVNDLLVWMIEYPIPVRIKPPLDNRFIGHPLNIDRNA